MPEETINNNYLQGHYGVVDPSRNNSSSSEKLIEDQDMMQDDDYDNDDF
jgi:hypothetical protein